MTARQIFNLSQLEEKERDIQLSIWNTKMKDKPEEKHKAFLKAQRMQKILFYSKKFNFNLKIWDDLTYVMFKLN